MIYVAYIVHAFAVCSLYVSIMPKDAVRSGLACSGDPVARVGVFVIGVVALAAGYWLALPGGGAS